MDRLVVFCVILILHIKPYLGIYCIKSKVYSKMNEMNFANWAECGPELDIQIPKHSILMRI